MLSAVRRRRWQMEFDVSGFQIPPGDSGSQLQLTPVDSRTKERESPHPVEERRLIAM